MFKKHCERPLNQPIQNFYVCLRSIFHVYLFLPLCYYYTSWGGIDTFADSSFFNIFVFTL